MPINMEAKDILVEAVFGRSITNYESRMDQVAANQRHR